MTETLLSTLYCFLPPGASRRNSKRKDIRQWFYKCPVVFKTIGLAVVLWLTIGRAIADPTTYVSNGDYRAPRIALNQTRAIALDQEPSRISVGNPDIADIVTLENNTILIVAKKIGQTNVRVWGANNRPMALFDVEVVQELTMLKRRLYQILPDEPIEVRASGKDVVLSGEVSSTLHLDTAMRVAESFVKATDAGASAINMMNIGGARQVMLEVKVAEVQRNHLKRLGVNFNVLSNSGNWSFGGVTGGGSFGGVADGGSFTLGGGLGTQLPVFTPDNVTLPGSGIFGSLLTGDTLLNLYIDAAKDNDIAKILAEPTLTTMSGSQARFIAGGEFPVPVASGNNQSGISVDYKEYGVGIDFLPMVLGTDKINLNLNVTVSDVTQMNAVSIGDIGGQSTMIVPALNKRSAESTVELLDGQTIAIAGLVNETMRDIVNKFPVLGDVPILGQLFRSQEFRKGQTELVIMVTPRLAQPLANNSMALPTDSFVEPGDREFYLMGRVRDSESGGFSIPLRGTRGVYGHDLDGGMR